MFKRLFYGLLVFTIGVSSSVCDAKETNQIIPILVYHSIANHQSGPDPQLYVTPKKFEFRVH